MSTSFDPWLQEQLFAAVNARKTDLVINFLRAGADPNADSDGSKLKYSPMFAAAKIGHTPSLQALTDAGGDINKVNDQKSTPLMTAATLNQVEAGRWLLQHGADLSMKNGFDETALILALSYEQIEFADMLMAEQPKFCTDQLENTAKYLIGRIVFRASQWLLKHGVSPDLTAEDGRSWICAVQSRNVHMTKPVNDLLISAGANLNKLDSSGNSPLHEAWRFRNVPSMVSLLNAGADPELPDRNGFNLRQKIHSMPLLDEFRVAFEAWDASCNAKRIIEEQGPFGLRPL